LGALDHPHDMRFGAAARLAVDAHHHLVAVHDAAHLAAIQIKIFSIFVIAD
jgi:hypothetical protein